MTRITGVLADEHQNILKLIDFMLAECELVENGKEIDKGFFERAIDFIRNYADRYHHAKEEDILFKVMLENLEGMHCNPIPVMLDEHETGRHYVRGIEEGLNESNKEKIVGNARGFGSLLQQHIFKEDNVLYPMAEEALNDQQKAEVLRKYDEVNSGEFSNEKIQNYLSLLNDKLF